MIYSNCNGCLIVAICLLWLPINVMKHLAMFVGENCNWLCNDFPKQLPLD